MVISNIYVHEIFWYLKLNLVYAQNFNFDENILSTIKKLWCNLSSFIFASCGFLHTYLVNPLGVPTTRHNCLATLDDMMSPGYVSITVSKYINTMSPPTHVWFYWWLMSGKWLQYSQKLLHWLIVVVQSYARSLYKLNTLLILANFY